MKTKYYAIIHENSVLYFTGYLKRMSKHDKVTTLQQYITGVDIEYKT